MYTKGLFRSNIAHKPVRSLSSAHEKWGQKQSFCSVYTHTNTYSSVHFPITKYLLLCTSSHIILLAWTIRAHLWKVLQTRWYSRWARI